MNMSPTKDLNSAFVNIFKPYFDTIFFISVIPTSSSEISVLSGHSLCNVDFPL